MGEPRRKKGGQSPLQVYSRSVPRFKEKLKAYSQPNVGDGRGINRD
jgi:hypothetical protein